MTFIRIPNLSPNIKLPKYLPRISNLKRESDYYFWTIIFLASIFLFSKNLHAQNYPGPGNSLTSEQNQKIWGKYCKGTANSADIPEVNYGNSDVLRAAMKLSTIADQSFYFYSGPRNAYGITPNRSFNGIPSGVTKNAHTFLTLLCGEFRDRATMVEAKINWVLNLYKLSLEEQHSIDFDKNIWSQVSARSYRSYIDFSQDLWIARQQANLRLNDYRGSKVSQQESNAWEVNQLGEVLYDPSGNPKRRVTGHFTLGKYAVEVPIEGQLACETKFIFDQYIGKRRVFDNLESYETAYKTFAVAPGHCSTSDKNSYYDFRGDSNFKHYSPESNAMIWYATSVAEKCASTKTAMGSPKTGQPLKDDDCATYFREPFRARWGAARASLATWLFRDKPFDAVFANTQTLITMISHLNDFSRPFSFRIGMGDYNAFLPGWSFDGLNAPDMGFNDFFHFSSKGVSQADLSFAYERLRDAANRHTDFYNSGFDNLNGMARTQGFTPFVASSYVMKASDAFTAPGFTIEKKPDSDDRKHWMFVFKIPKSKWYHAGDAAQGKPINFDQMWFDETSLGTSPLADDERAWDRLGTAMEDELDSILYLHNIDVVGNVSDDELPDPNAL